MRTCELYFSILLLLFVVRSRLFCSSGHIPDPGVAICNRLVSMLRLSEPCGFLVLRWRLHMVVTTVSEAPHSANGQRVSRFQVIAMSCTRTVVQYISLPPSRIEPWVPSLLFCKIGLDTRSFLTTRMEAMHGRRSGVVVSLPSSTRSSFLLVAHVYIHCVYAQTVACQRPMDR